jgi:hypothetical protein
VAWSNLKADEHIRNSVVRTSSLFSPPFSQVPPVACTIHSLSAHLSLSAQFASPSLLSSHLPLCSAHVSLSVSSHLPLYSAHICLSTQLDEEDKKVAHAKVLSMRDEHREDHGGMFLASVSRDRTIRLWLVFDGICVKTIVCSVPLLCPFCAPPLPLLCPIAHICSC